ncbi:MAG: GHKL domain-containing protein [Prevotellaceae bacterium]|jgi:signal transduction histidine kinase|nr:GHKL domain-containing protein [Prevotellaceae bacterium]
MNKQQTFFIRIGVFVLFTLLCIGANMIFLSKENNVPIKKFNEVLHKKEAEAHNSMQILKQNIRQSEQKNTNLLSFIDLKKIESPDIFYYIVKDGNLIFWNDNQLDIKSLNINFLTNNLFVKLSNASCLFKMDTMKNLQIFALIKIQNNYSISNNYVQNNFAKGFPQRQNLTINQYDRTGKYQVKAANGKFLFSLETTNSKSANNIWNWIALILFLSAFIAYCNVYYNLNEILGRKIFDLKSYLIVSAIFPALPVLLAYLKIPAAVFQHELFSPLYYSNIFNSLGSLGISTLLTTTLIFTFYFKARFRLFGNKKAWFCIIYGFFALYFFLTVKMIDDIIYNSTIDVFTLPLFKEFSVYSIIALVFVVLWILGYIYLFRRFLFELKRYIKVNFVISAEIIFSLVLWLILRIFGVQYATWIASSFFVISILIDIVIYFSQNINSLISILALCYFSSVFLVHYSYKTQQESQYQMAHSIAENLISDECDLFDINNEGIINSIFEIDSMIANDRNIKDFIKNKQQIDGNVHTLLQYLRKYYLNNILYNNYVIKIQIVPQNSPVLNSINNKIEMGNIKYISPHILHNQHSDELQLFLGIFTYDGIDGDNTLIINIENEINFSVEYGFPDKIFNNKDIKHHKIFSCAVYRNERLVYKKGLYSYPLESNFEILDKKFHSDLQNDNIHYIFKYPDDIKIVVSREYLGLSKTYILNYTYILLVFTIAILILTYAFKSKYKRIKSQKSIMSRLQKVFVYTMLSVFATVATALLYLTYNEYRRLYNQNLDLQSKYVSVELSQFISNNHAENNSHLLNENLLNFVDLLSRKYDIDINVFNPEGELVASSRPYVFINRFLSNLINPNYFFSITDDQTTVSNHIGSLTYTSGYNVIYDKLGNILAYIEIPVFLATNYLWTEILTFMAVILNVFFIIFITAIFINISITQRVSLYINKLEESLKTISFIEKNEKIQIDDSQIVDEIGSLVRQYNSMIDEIEVSTQILAQKERESIWREMAQQIAHEIKNPLTPMKLSIQQLQRLKENDSPDFDNYFDKMSKVLMEQINSMSQIANSFSNMAKINPERFSKVDIIKKIVAAIELFKNNDKNVKIIFKSSLAKAVAVTDREHIIEVFNNVLKNAIQAIPRGRKGKIEVSAEKDGDDILISIKDNGAGISDDTLDKIFTPKFSTKSHGSGLGLSIAKNIIEVSNGKIWFKTKSNYGTTFFIKLPMV